MKMSDVSISVQELLADGLPYEQIAEKLGIPLQWVEEEARWYSESMDEYS